MTKKPTSLKVRDDVTLSDDDLQRHRAGDKEVMRQRLIDAVWKGRERYFKSRADYLANGVFRSEVLIEFQAMAAVDGPAHMALLKLVNREGLDFYFAMSVSDLRVMGETLMADAKRLAAELTRNGDKA